MRFKFNNFEVNTEQLKIELDELYTKPLELEYNNARVRKYELVNKTKQITIFSNLKLFIKSRSYQKIVIDDLFEFIALIEILKAFSANKLDIEKKYREDSFTGEIVQKNKKFYLKIDLTDLEWNDFVSDSDSDYVLFLDKFECTSLAAKFSKILSRCEVWQELDQ